MPRWTNKSKDDLVDTILALGVSGVPTRERVALGVLQASLAGLSQAEILQLAKAGIFPANGSKWRDYRALLTASQGDVQLAQGAIDAGLTPAELAQMVKEPGFTADTVHTLAKVQETFVYAGSAEEENDRKESASISVKGLRSRMRRST